jgi:hypothetical protein
LNLVSHRKPRISGAIFAGGDFTRAPSEASESLAARVESQNWCSVRAGVPSRPNIALV